MPIPSQQQWLSDTSRWWYSRSTELKALDAALGLYRLDRSHERFVGLARALKAWMQSKDKNGWAKSTRNIGRNASKVADLVNAVAASEYWQGARGGTDLATLAQYFRDQATALNDVLPNPFNRQFLANPEDFLGRHSVYCYNKDSTIEALASYNLTSHLLGGTKALGFEFQKAEKQGTQVSLKIVPDGDGGEDIISAGWIPYTGQVKTPDPNTFGHLCVLSTTYDFIFTVGLGGCRIAVVNGRDGLTHMYHEPTQERWGKDPAYDGELVGYFAPAYSDTVIAGFTCLQRRPRGWRALIQEFGDGGTVARLRVEDVGR